jgi:hypothetical protein
MLRAHELPVWYSPTEIIGAQQWHDEIGAALDRCDWFLIVLSPHGVKSEWVRREVLFALNDPRYNGRIAPLIAKKCDSRKLSWTLGALQYIDFTPSFSAGARELLRIWGKGYKGA